MPTAIVVGSGAGGATVARELQGAFDVTVLEAGRPFRRLGLERATIQRLRDSRVLFDPRLIRAAFPAMQVRRTGEMYLVNGIGVGGTTPMATGNGIRADAAIRALGIDLDPESTRSAARSTCPPPTGRAGTRPPGACSRPAPSWTSTRDRSPR
jgi:choline dehydrogenase-like flavoprotein